MELNINKSFEWLAIVIENPVLDILLWKVYSLD